MAIKYNKAHELAQSLKKKKKYENILNVLENNRTTTNAIQNRTTREINNRILNGGTIAPVYSSDTSSKKTQLNIISEEEQKAKLKTPLELLQEQQQKQFEERQQKSKEASEKRVEQKKKDEKEEDPDVIYQNKVLKNVMSEYSGLSKEELLKLREENIEQQKKIMKKGDYKTQNRKWWNSDDNILENAGNVLYKLFAEQDPYTFSDEYNELIAREMAIQKAIEGKTLEDKKYDKGVAGGLEKVGDALASGFMRGTRGIEDTAKKILGQEESKTEEEMIATLGGRKTYIEQLGNKAIQETENKIGKAGLEIAQSTGQQIPQLVFAGLGLPSKATTLLAGANFGGSAYSDAKDQGYTEEQATNYGIAVGSLETLLNKLLPSFSIDGKNVYGKTATDKISSKIMSKVVGNEFFKRTITQSAGEFTEEYLQEFLDPIVRETLLEEDNGVGIKKADDLGELAKNISSYTAKNFFSKENAYAGLLGAVSSATISAQSNYDAYKYNKETGRNIDTGLTQNEQSVIDNVVSQRTTEMQKQKAVEERINKVIEEQEATRGTLTDEAKQEIKNRVMQEDIDYSTSKLSKKEIAKIEEEVRQDLERGEIDIDTIENTLSSEKTAQIKELIEEISKTTNEQERLKIQTEIGKLQEAKNSELIEMLKKDNLLQNSYREANLKNEKFTYEAKDTDSEYKKKLAEDFKKIANNSTRTHETFEMISKIAEDSNTNYSITNNEQLKNLGYDIDGKDVNGLVRVNKDGSQSVLINIDSKKAINRIVGHETTHILEGTKEYDEFKEFAKQYATTKGEYDSRLKSTKELYKGVKDANVENEVTADIVGDYLFTDTDFVNSLSVEKPTVFQKVKDLIDDLVVKVKGTKEEKQLREVQKKFKEAYRKMSNTTTKQNESNLITEADSNTLNNVKYSLEKTNDGTEYVKTENNLFNKEDGTSMTQREIYSSLIGKSITFNDGITATIVNRLPSKDMYNELFKRYPKYENIQNIKSTNNHINENIIELLENSDNISANEQDYMNRHQKQGISTFDTRSVSFFDGNKAYDLTFSIAKLSDGKYVAYAKRNLSSNDKLLNEIKKEMPRSKSSLTSLNDNSISKNDTLVNNSISKNTKNDTKYSLSNTDLKQKQLDIVLENNPAEDDYHTWIRNVDDIKTFEETLKDPSWSDYVDEGFNPDFTGDMVKEALNKGKITVYSSYPIEQGIFVSPSKMEAESYSGNGKVYSKEVNLTDVAWIDPTQGQYAKVNDTKYSLSENIPLENRVSGDELLDAQDLIDEVKSVGAQVDANGYVTVYHQTSNENAQIIKETGKMISKELDIFFSTSKDAQQSTGRGQTKLEFKIPAEKLLLDDIFSDNADVKIPLNGSRSLDVSNYLVTDYDTNLSLGNQQTAPARNDVFGKDIKYQDETTKQVEQAIAPLKEEVKTLTKEITDLRENVAPISLEEAEMLRKESFNSITDKDIAPIKEDTTSEYQYENDNNGTESMYDEISNDTPKNDRELIDEIRDTFSVKQYEARNILDDIKKAESKKEIYDILYKNRYYEEQTGENTEELKKRIRNTKLDMSNEKLQMGKQDYNEFRKRNFGNLKLGNDGMSVDSFYQELSEMYPNYFKPSVNNVADQLEVISDFMKTDHSTATMEMQKDELLFMANYYYNQLENRKLINNYYKSILENQPGKEVSDLYSFFDGEIPDEVMLSNIDNVAEKMIQEKQAKREKIEKNNTLNYISKDSTKESTYDDPSITNPVDAFLNKELTNRFEKRNKQTVISKQKGKSTFRDTMSYLFVNKNRAIDKYSDEIGNKNIKILADHVNNVFGEISTNISKVQTDNNGKAIGKGITEIFNQARKSKVSEAFDDYLFHKSNIERHKNGKGSVVPANDSARLVLEYEKTYPEFKTWGDEVNNFNKNNLYKQVDAGLITKELADNITNMYDFYVPFFENIERDYVKTDTGEITTRSAVKRAKGGADKNLLGFEKAMMKQTQNTISSIRKNQLYREIIDSTHNKQIGLDLNDGTFADENGYYLTAYEDGSQVSANISKELYDGLNNNLEQTVKDVEQKLSLITKPLQALSNVRRNLLTNWSPTFIITNPVKDFQDAPLNSKYAKDWAVNYPKALKELTTGKGEHLETFLNMYGQANLMGDYSIDSGISDITKSVKIKGKSKLSVGALNELAELTPRYAEYLASIKNGTSQMEALYNAREVTTNFGRGGVITKALNRNGFTFLNASVQGFNKLYRNFSGENGARGVVKASLKALSLGVAPALYNALMFGLGDDEDEDYKVLPDYIKDNYYLIKTDNGNFIRIPKGRMISVFGSAGRRTLELMQGEKDAFDGYLKNAYSQVGISNPMESNILAPLIQAYGSENGKTWYGTDIVPSRLQDVPKDEQYDESIDKLSIWLGEKTGISPYKANYVIDQYTGGIGDMILPTITEEAQSDSDSLLGTAIAPLKDKFTADSTTDNKYVSEFYTKNDELKVKANSSKATEEDLLVNQYMKSVSSEMGALYSEMREVQANKNLSKSEKYKKAQAIKKQINELAEEGLNGYKNVNKTDNYAEVGGREFYKWTNDEGEVVWSKPDEAESDELNAMGLDIQEKSSYYTTKSKIYDIWDKYGDSDNYESKNKEIGQAIINSGLPDEAKYSLYDFSKGKYADTETTQALKLLDLDADTFISYASQTFKADKDSNGKSISGSKKKKVFDYINSMRNISFEQKAILAKLQYNNYDEWNYDIIDYLNNSSMTYEEMEFVLKQMGFKVKNDGTITWD